MAMHPGSVRALKRERARREMDLAIVRQKESLEPIFQRYSQLEELPNLIAEAKFLDSLSRNIFIVLLLNSAILGLLVAFLNVAGPYGIWAFPALILANLTLVGKGLWEIIPNLARYPNGDAVSAISASTSLRYYFVLVYLFAFLYSAAALFGVEFTQEMRPSTALYFSTVTTTTLGYGDIVPVSVGARAIAATNAVLGVAFFLYSIILSTVAVGKSMRTDLEVNNIVRGCIRNIEKEIRKVMEEVGEEGFLNADPEDARSATIRHLFSRARE